MGPAECDADLVGAPIRLPDTGCETKKRVVIHWNVHLPNHPCFYISKMSLGTSSKCCIFLKIMSIEYLQRSCLLRSSKVMFCLKFEDLASS